MLNRVPKQIQHIMVFTLCAWESLTKQCWTRRPKKHKASVTTDSSSSKSVEYNSFVGMLDDNQTLLNIIQQGNQTNSIVLKEVESSFWIRSRMQSLSLNKILHKHGNLCDCLYTIFQFKQAAAERLSSVSLPELTRQRKNSNQNTLKFQVLILLSRNGLSHLHLADIWSLISTLQQQI